jgi:hypothetical protein
MTEPKRTPLPKMPPLHVENLPPALERVGGRFSCWGGTNYTPTSSGNDEPAA